MAGIFFAEDLDKDSFCVRNLPKLPLYVWNFAALFFIGITNISRSEGDVAKRVGINKRNILGTPLSGRLSARRVTPKLAGGKARKSEKRARRKEERGKALERERKKGLERVRGMAFKMNDKPCCLETNVFHGETKRVTSVSHSL